MELPGGKGWAAPSGARHVLRISVAALVFTAICTGWATPASAVVGITGARQVSSGDLHSCALLAGGGVQCWGDNSNGQLGDGTQTERTTPARVKGIAAATQIAAGGYHTCALIAGGSVKCWGDNYDGELGDGTTLERRTPVLVRGIKRATSITAGFYDTCARLLGGAVKCWGGNAYGDLGQGTAAGPDRCGANRDPCSRRPVAVKGIARATSITAGAYHACAALADGHVRCWGSSAYGQLGNGTRSGSATPVAVKGITSASQISASTLHTCALLARGTVVCWGDNNNGQLGDGTLSGPQQCGGYACSTTPVAVKGITGAKQISAAGDTSSDGDGDHACALLAGGSVRCWGANYSGELGDGTTTDRRTPVAVHGVARATQVAAGGFASCAILRGGRITCWGDNSSGELGSGTTTGMRARPVSVKGIGNATSVAAGGYHSCAVLAGGKLACWGDNTNGELGNGATGESLTEVPVLGITSATHVTAGDYHSCALIVTGSIQCWGDNSRGELGDGTTSGPKSCAGDPCSPTPVPVTGVSTATQITASNFQSCALLSGGGVDCWGDNANGQLGDGTTITRSTPVAVQGISNATQIAAGGLHSCALLSGGGVDCWGSNADGQLGNGTISASTTPTAVQGITDATQIAAGEYHTCALLAAGSVRCWGNNYDGELGNGSDVSSSTPVDVQGITTATQITAGYFHTCALLADGSVKCWGYNFDGELGDASSNGPQTCGTYDDPCSRNPVRVKGITGATQISAGGIHACARLTSGALKCWGGNYDGELGDGTAGYSVMPVLGRTAVAIPLSGVVSVEAPRGKSLKALRAAPAPSAAVKASGTFAARRTPQGAKRPGFVRLTGARPIPIGSRVDAHAGTIQLVTATGIGHQTQTGSFGGGLFSVGQATSKAQKGLTTLTLLTGALKGQPGYSVCGASASAAHATARKPLSHRILSSLRAHAHGSFSVRGKYSAATVRGTVWDTIDRCDGTLTVVHSGTVLVADFVTHKTIAVRAGHSYLAKAP